MISKLVASRGGDSPQTATMISSTDTGLALVQQE
jgi:hypothetical protein